MTTIQELLDRYESQKDIMSMSAKNNLLFEMAEKLKEIVDNLQTKIDNYDRDLSILL